MQLQDQIGILPRRRVGGRRLLLEEDHRMKIAQIAPLAESVPPKLYGGTERIVSYITEELVHQGHDVTLFASGDSVTSAKLVPVTASPGPAKPAPAKPAPAKPASN